MSAGEAGAFEVADEALAASLTLAVVSGSLGRLLLLDGDLRIVAASPSFCRVFDFDPRYMIGQEVSALGAGEWDAPELRELLQAATRPGAAMETVEFGLRRRGRNTRRLVAHIERLVYSDPDPIRLILSVADITDATAEATLREAIGRSEALLAREVRHRISNSLQIVASVLLLNARTAKAEEARRHLHAAHSRVMAVAALEQRLSNTSHGMVDLESYLTELCTNLSASAIADPGKVSLRTFVDPFVVNASTAASMGMIVTELVINALKHAFPGGRPGHVTIAFDAQGPDWVLSVGDNGVGMPEVPTHGLGTDIVKALTKQLHATVTVADAGPGTVTSICRSHLAAAGLSPFGTPR